MQTETLISTLIFKHSLSTNWSRHGVESRSPSLANCLHGLIALYAILISAFSHTCPVLGIRQLTPSPAQSPSFSLFLFVLYFTTCGFFIFPDMRDPSSLCFSSPGDTYLRSPVVLQSSHGLGLKWEGSTHPPLSWAAFSGSWLWDRT